ncbi:MAG: stage 0 sporulation family protein [Clostridia bacterium]|nr:stage 0 sporulation family protein [Clostridia bacterium]
MTEIIGVRFKKSSKVYYFSPGKNKIDAGMKVIVETARGVEIGDVTIGNKMVEDTSVVSPLKPVLRIATAQDIRQAEDNIEREKEAFKICQEKIESHNLDMKLVEVEYTFDQNKILFYFTADGRVDFRDLVKDLAAVFRTRIELRQIGVRDEAKLLGGLGICGRKLCCASHLGNFEPVSIKMAKEQNLSLNPTKISGNCSRLMCCLKYEQDAYEDLLKNTPSVGSLVKTSEGKGRVVEVNLLRGLLKVHYESDAEGVSHLVHADEVKVLKSAHVHIDESELKELKELEE